MFVSTVLFILQIFNELYSDCQKLTRKTLQGNLPIWNNEKYRDDASHENIFHVTSPSWGETTSDWWIPLTEAIGAKFDVFFDVRLKLFLNKCEHVEVPLKGHNIIEMDILNSNFTPQETGRHQLSRLSGYDNNNRDCETLWENIIGRLYTRFYYVAPLKYWGGIVICHI